MAKTSKKGSREALPTKHESLLVQMPEWGVSLEVRKAPQSFVDGVKESLSMGEALAPFNLVAECVYTIEGDRVFQDGLAVTRRNPEVTKRLIDAALDINAVSIGAKNGNHKDEGREPTKP